VRRELRLGAASLRRRPLLGLLGWSLPEALPAAASGLAIARAVDAGFLAGRPVVGLAWLGALVLASVVGAAGSRQVFRRLGDIVEPFRDDLVRRVVAGALRDGVAGRHDAGALARLTRQVEIVRDSYAGLIVVLRSFAVTVTGVVAGLLSVAPIVVLLVMPPFLIGLAAFVATLGFAAARQRAAVLADEQLAGSASAVLAGARDLVARGAERRGADLVAGPIREQAAAERALARVAALRTLCFAIGGWVPLLVVLFAGPWLAGRGLTAGAIMGGLTYVLFGLQPALQSLIVGLGGSGLRFVVTLGRILDAESPAAPVPGPAGGSVSGPVADTAAGPVGLACGPASGVAPAANPTLDPAASPAPCSAAGPVPSAAADPALGRPDLVARGVTFAYGPHAEPVLRDLDLDVPAGDHLAVVGPSGIGKSTLAALLCGLHTPDAGRIVLGATPVAALPAPELARLRVLIPQEAYVFGGTVLENLTYLHPYASAAEVERAVAMVGAESLVARLGGLTAELAPAELSAGERQLIALARAYLSPAPIAVLDEATCHLDPVAERRVEEAFAARGGTLIVIAHRISSALRADRVLVLDGVSAIAGDHRTLLSTSPLYRDLLGHWQPNPPQLEPVAPSRQVTRDVELSTPVTWASHGV
jgi:ATP-binding cassette, subfamily C, bacterial